MNPFERPAQLVEELFGASGQTMIYGTVKNMQVVLAANQPLAGYTSVSNWYEKPLEKSEAVRYRGKLLDMRAFSLPRHCSIWKDGKLVRTEYVWEVTEQERVLFGVNGEYAYIATWPLFDMIGRTETASKTLKNTAIPKEQIAAHEATHLGTNRQLERLWTEYGLGSPPNRWVMNTVFDCSFEEILPIFAGRVYLERWHPELVPVMDTIYLSCGDPGRRRAQKLVMENRPLVEEMAATVKEWNRGKQTRDLYGKFGGQFAQGMSGERGEGFYDVMGG